MPSPDIIIGGTALVGAYLGWTRWLPYLGYTDDLAKVISLGVPLMSGAITGVAILVAMGDYGSGSPAMATLTKPGGMAGLTPSSKMIDAGVGLMLAVAGLGLGIQWAGAELLQPYIASQPLRALVAPLVMGTIIRMY